MEVKPSKKSLPAQKCRQRFLVSLGYVNIVRYTKSNSKLRTVKLKQNQSLIAPGKKGLRTRPFGSVIRMHASDALA